MDMGSSRWLMQTAGVTGAILLGLIGCRSPEAQPPANKNLIEDGLGIRQPLMPVDLQPGQYTGLIFADQSSIRPAAEDLPGAGGSDPAASATPAADGTTPTPSAGESAEPVDGSSTEPTPTPAAESDDSSSDPAAEGDSETGGS